MIISILGCGWLGMPLAETLIARRHQVNGSTTTAGKLTLMRYKQISPYLFDLSLTKPSHLESSPFFDCDALVIAIPPKKADAYPEMIARLIDVIKPRQIPKILFISSTSVYGDYNRRVDENFHPQPTKPAGKMILAAENALTENTTQKTICLRFGGLVGPGRSPGYFFKTLEPIPNGLAPVNLIHLDDCLPIAVQLLEENHENIRINAVCPHHPPRVSFYTISARAVGQPLPRFIHEKTSWKIVNSRYLPSLLNYEFRIKNWFAWLSEAPRE